MSGPTVLTGDTLMEALGTELLDIAKFQKIMKQYPLLFIQA